MQLPRAALRPPPSCMPLPRAALGLMWLLSAVPRAARYKSLDEVIARTVPHIRAAVTGYANTPAAALRVRDVCALGAPGQPRARVGKRASGSGGADSAIMLPAHKWRAPAGD